ncbi:MAG: DUF3108 domain-containing protein [Candidatus Omnitrophica bacterium]|nr:DUF3108 domain-containing protein [Candidatus Omnitrophota bacterium]
MRKCINFILICSFFVAVMWILSSEEGLALESQDLIATFDHPFVGEEIVYDIKKFGLKVGEAKLNFSGTVKKNGQTAFLIIFTAQAINFYDQERIYVDPVTYKPLRVERDIDLWGKKEKIVEEYLTQEGKIKITKEVKGKMEDLSIEKTGSVDNIYGFIYSFRAGRRYNPGDVFQLRLPTKDVMIQYVEEKKIKIGSTKHDTMYLQSDPKQYHIWFENNEQRIPLRIDGALGSIKAALVMRDNTAIRVEDAMNKEE